MRSASSPAAPAATPIVRGDGIASEAGSLSVPIEITAAIEVGVVSLPHGWGHDKAGTRLSVANEHPGVNTSVLSPGEFVDVLSGNAAVNGIPVTVTPA